MLFNFRFDQTHTRTILDLLQKNESELAQGWGGGEVNLDLNREDFVQATLGCYQADGMKSTRIPTNLTRMRTFKDGDLLVTPHLPERGKASLHVVRGDFPECYRYVPNEEDHLNHRILIRRSYGLGGNISIYNDALSAWYAKLQWLRLPVLAIPEHDESFRHVLDELVREPEKVFAVSPLEERLERLLGGVIHRLKADLRTEFTNTGSDVSFEALCEKLVLDSGYTVVRRNFFDGQGGDVDIQCTRKRVTTSPFETGDVTLYLQVKKHAGKTDEEAVLQLIRMMAQDSSAEGCVMSVADDFTDHAKELAAQNDILLMDGNAVCKLVLKTMLGE